MTKVESSKLSATKKSPVAVTSTTSSSTGASVSTTTSSTASTKSDMETETTSSATSTSFDSANVSVTESLSTETATTTSTEDAPKKSNVSNNVPQAATRQDSKSTLTTVELQVLSELDSTQFGFVRLNEEAGARKKTLVLKAIKYLERFIVRSRERQRRAAAEPNNNGKNRPNEINSSLYCKLGHLHLLLENFSKALSAYQMFFRLKKGAIHRINSS